MTYPRTIDDGHGSRLTFLGLRVGEHGDHLEVSGSVDPGAGPAMHVHHLQTETLTVRSGRVGVEIAGEPERFAGPGERITFEPGVPHRFWNAGDGELVVDGEAYPPHNLEWFLTQIYASSAAHGGRPGALDGAYLSTRYRDEFEVTAIPTVVRRFVFPVQTLLGRLLGRYSHFTEAPPPFRRGSGVRLTGRTTSARSSAG